MTKYRFMTFTLLLACLLWPVSPTVSLAEKPAVVFFSHIYDLPLPPKMQELVEEAVIFDNPTGRVVESVAIGPNSKNNIIAFYQSSLPQLGWHSADQVGLIYQRGGEKITLRIETRHNDRRILFMTLTPVK